ncbi:MAG: hypothetical protein JXA28_09935 [Bacteroidetes bacterium]|nr:hypothetical protein [Bacteroidota bacterium]
MTRFPSFLLVLFSATLLIACSEDEPSSMTHYFNPLWTPDGNTVVAGYLQGPEGPIDPPAGNTDPPGTLAVMDMATRSERIITLPAVSTVHELYAFDPSGKALAFIESDAIYFYDLTGSLLLRHQSAEGGIPVVMDFGNSGNSMLWIGSTPEGYTVNTIQYDPGTWSVENQLTMMTLQKDASVEALRHTSQRSFAIRFDNGRIVEYDFNGTVLNTFTSIPFETVNPWHKRLMYFSRNGERAIYIRDGEGLKRLDLVSGLPRLLVKGEVIDMDISATRSSMVYETTTGDVWIATVEGSPLTRIAPQNLMPRISPADNGIAMVERVDRYTDSLHVLRLR